MTEPSPASGLTFRNVDADPAGPVADWPFEALSAAIERGYLSDWRRIATEVRRSPWGRAARGVETYATGRDNTGVSALLMDAVRSARAAAEASEQREVARRVDQAVRASGLTARDFAALVGTSPSRLSTYRSGAVQPSAAMLVRIQRART